MIRKVLAWLVRPQYNALLVGGAFVIGNLVFFNLAWWGNVIAGCLIGTIYGLLSLCFIPWFLRRKARQS
jgi:hypothetical protein